MALTVLNAPKSAFGLDCLICAKASIWLCLSLIPSLTINHSHSPSLAHSHLLALTLIHRRSLTHSHAIKPTHSYSLSLILTLIYPHSFAFTYSIRLSLSLTYLPYLHAFTVSYYQPLIFRLICSLPLVHSLSLLLIHFHFPFLSFFLFLVPSCTGEFKNQSKPGGFFAHENDLKDA